MLNILSFTGRSKSGRRAISFVAHEIYTDNVSSNKNGLAWKKEYVEANLDSVKGMAIACEFISDEEVPNGHGYTGVEKTENGIEPIFEDSVVVGTVDSGAIEEIEVDGKKILALVCYGWIYTQRYPKFYKWLKKSVLLGTVDTSVEITGKEGNDIVYENDIANEKYRVPKIYDYTASCVLSVEPADDSAIVLEVAQANGTKNKEEDKLTEKEILEVVTKAISETNSAKADVDAKIKELNEKIEEKDAELKKAADEKMAEANACADKDKQIEELNAKISELEKKVADAKCAEQNAALDKAIEKFSDEEKKYAEVEINSFKENPLEGNIDAIRTKILAGIGEATKVAEQNAKIAEINEAKKHENEAEDIFGDVVEVNNADSDFDLLA